MSGWLSGSPEEKIVIIGIGNELRNDDIAGILIIEKLQGKLSSNIKLIDCGQVPENFTKDIINYSPNRIIIVDIVDFGGSPGDITSIKKDEIRGISFSTHNYDLSLFIKYIENFISPEINIIGIQPKSYDLGTELSGEVDGAIGEIVEAITARFK